MMIYPDLKWYESISNDKALSTRCPFASASRCPRYYESLSLLGDAGLTTKIESDKDQKLLERWGKSDLWPSVKEQASSISGTNNSKSHFDTFCPEVAFNTFGLFATYLSRYADEIDKESMHSALIASGVAGAEDWRWSWAHVEPLHFSQCPLYSLLLQSQNVDNNENNPTEVMQLRPTMYGFSIDLKQLWVKFKSWSQKKRNAKSI